MVGKRYMCKVGYSAEYATAIWQRVHGARPNGQVAQIQQ